MALIKALKFFRFQNALAIYVVRSLILLRINSGSPMLGYNPSVEYA